MNILALNMNHIGDVLFTTPALTALKRGYPDAVLTVVVGPRAQEVLAGNPDVTEVVPLPATGGERWRLLRRLRGRRFDLSVCFSSSNLELAAAGLLLGCRRRWGFERQDTRLFLNGRVRHDLRRHWIDDYLALGSAAGGVEAGRLPAITLAPEEEAWAEEYRARLGIGAGEFVAGMHVGASYPQKCWRPERYAEVAQRVARERAGRTLIFGGPEEEASGDKVAGHVPGAINLAGKLSLRQYMALVKRCSLFVGGDSGPTHVAAALGVPTVGLYGYTNPSRMGTRGPRAAVLDKSGDWGGALYREGRAPYEWLDKITPEEVWKTACRISAS